MCCGTKTAKSAGNNDIAKGKLVAGNNFPISLKYTQAYKTQIFLLADSFLFFPVYRIESFSVDKTSKHN